MVGKCLMTATCNFCFWQRTALWLYVLTRHNLQSGQVRNGLRCKTTSSVGAFWLQVLTLVVRYILQSEDEAMALLGVNLLQELVGQMAPAADEAAWQAIIAECRRACSARALLVLLAGDVR